MPAAWRAVPLMLTAPVPSSATGTPTGVTEGEIAGAEPGDGPPIFESVRSGYPHAFGRGLLRFGEQQAGQSLAGWPARRPASWGDGSADAVAGPPAAARPASSWLPQRIPQPRQVHGEAADQETRQASVAEPAEITRSKLASFQRGSRRARSVAQMNRSAEQPGQDG